MIEFASWFYTSGGICLEVAKKIRGVFFSSIVFQVSEHGRSPVVTMSFNVFQYYNGLILDGFYWLYLAI